jgi:hypothetical protein
MGEMRETYRVFVGKPEGRENLDVSMILIGSEK